MFNSVDTSRHWQFAEFLGQGDTILERSRCKSVQYDFGFSLNGFRHSDVTLGSFPIIQYDRTPQKSDRTPQKSDRTPQKSAPQKSDRPPKKAIAPYKKAIAPHKKSDRPLMGLRNRVSFFTATVNCYIHNRNPVSFFGVKNQELRNRVSFLAAKVNCDIHNRNPVSFLGQKPGTQKPGFFFAYHI
ncbi:hypothetical protein [Planktothricoides raciborskii]|uniref:Transposase n=1 Tax=Planktothricoides raciborskii GIHE-MW2 TaxID=2792601 RepID=A0AAU8JM00_9CYAN|nr:hypothetical protein [Planktothricoides raciborskii]